MSITDNSPRENSTMLTVTPQEKNEQKSELSIYFGKQLLEIRHINPPAGSKTTEPYNSRPTGPQQ